MKYIKGKPQKTEDIKLIEKVLTCTYEKCSLKPETLELVKNEKFFECCDEDGIDGTSKNCMGGRA